LEQNIASLAGHVIESTPEAMTDNLRGDVAIGR
jgi:hypothetical protein